MAAQLINLFLTLGFVLSGASGVYVCIESDGCVVLESRLNGCVTEATTQHTVAATPAVDQASVLCGRDACVDVTTWQPATRQGETHSAPVVELATPEFFADSPASIAPGADGSPPERLPVNTSAKRCYRLRRIQV